MSQGIGRTLGDGAGDGAGNGAADGSVTVTRDGAVLRLVLDRPARRNSLNHAMIDGLVEALTDAATDDRLRAVYVTGSGADFCSGADWVTTNSGGSVPVPVTWFAAFR